MNWKKVRLGDVLKHRKGNIVIDDNVEYKLCRVQLHRKGVVLRELLYGHQIQTKKQQVCKTGDFLVAEMDAKVGGYGFIPEYLNNAIVSSHYFLFELDTDKIRPQFLEVVSQMKILQEQIKAVGSTNYAAIRPANVLEWEIPFPPIEKQIEIEQIFKKAKLNVDKINHLYQRQLTLLENLNQAILQEAVQGKLVPQNPDDEPASELLKRIKTEKATLRQAQGKGKKEQPLPPIKPSEIPFEIPESWVWCRLGEIVDGVLDVDHKMPEKKSTGVPYVSPRDFYGINSIDFDGAKKISEQDYLSLSRKVKPEKFDIIFPRYGTIGVNRFLDFDKIFLPSYSCVTIKTNKLNTDPKYIFYYSICPFSKIEIDKHTVKTTQPNVGIKSILEFRLPFPPLSEQKRIVAEIEKQLAKTKQLKEHIIASQQATEQLLKALLHQAFEVKEPV